jgi:phosphatidylinositol alpha-1,6-mannosyltransferase
VSPARHLLVTNDFPPKVGGIQHLLHEWWRRLPPDSFAVLTTPHAGAREWDARQAFEVRRVREPWLVAHPLTVRRIREMARAHRADFVVLDPALPLGAVGPRLGLPYVVLVHGAELAVPARIPGLRGRLRRVLRGAERVVASGTYPAAEARRAGGADLDVRVVYPGVDTARFRPLDAREREVARRSLGVPGDAELVVGVSRLVPRKGFDVLIGAVARLARSRPRLRLLVGGDGRDRERLARLAASLGAPARLLGRVDDAALALLFGCADVAAMPCRTRWGGLEQEGFGIVFAEAAACGVPQVAGASGGAAEAVVHGVTGVVLDDPGSPDACAAALRGLLDDADERARMATASRRRALEVLDASVVAAHLADALPGEG